MAKVQRSVEVYACCTSHGSNQVPLHKAINAPAAPSAGAALTLSKELTGTLRKAQP